MKIYVPNGRAREYSPLALNYFKGCTHNCAYCYVNRLNAAYGNGCSQAVATIPQEKGFIELEKSAKTFEGCGKQILLSFTGDPYCDMPAETTTRVLEILNKYNHKVAILTKGGSRILRDLELFKRFGSRIKIGATLTFDKDEDSLMWEPGGALPVDRLRTLETLTRNGIKCWASFEPVISPSQSLNLLKNVATFIDHVKIGKLNDYKGLDKQIDWADFLKKARKICIENNCAYYVKNDLAEFGKDIEFSPEERDADYLSL